MVPFSSPAAVLFRDPMSTTCAVYPRRGSTTGRAMPTSLLATHTPSLTRWTRTLDKLLFNDIKVVCIFWIRDFSDPEILYTSCTPRRGSHPIISARHWIKGDHKHWHSSSPRPAHSHLWRENCSLIADEEYHTSIWAPIEWMFERNGSMTLSASRLPSSHFSHQTLQHPLNAEAVESVNNYSPFHCN